MPSVITSASTHEEFGAILKHIYISPHADDVALSCGGQILSNPARKDDTLVLNVFTSEGEVESALFDSVNEERTREDKSAWASLGVQTRYLDLPEALLRKRFPFQIFRRGDDSIVVAALCEAVGEYARSYPDAEFIFPAGFGNHVDHLACKDAAFRLLDEGRLRKIVLYEDVPYSWLKFIRDETYKTLLRNVELDRQSRALASRADGNSLFGYLAHGAVPFPRGKKLFPAVYLSLLVDSFRSSGLHREYKGKISALPLNKDQQAAKLRLLHHYKSQLPMLFGTDTSIALQHAHALFSKELRIEIIRKAAGG